MFERCLNIQLIRSTMIKAKVKSDLFFAPFKVKIKANKHVRRALLCVYIYTYIPYWHYYINKSKFFASKIEFP